MGATFIVAGFAALFVAPEYQNAPLTRIRRRSHRLVSGIARHHGG
jgi:hypothetical protein